MALKRIALIRSAGPVLWRSCKFIVDNLQTSYQRMPGVDARVFHFDPEADIGTCAGTIDELCRFQPDCVATIDEGPYAAWFIAEHWGKFPLPERTELRIHCFGDFSMLAEKWRKTELKLRDQRVRFVAASTRAAEIVRKSVIPPESVSAHPFPSDEGTFHFNSARRSEFREKLGLSSKDFFLLYTGRLSLQKNLTLLNQALKGLRGNERARLKLGLAGEFDNLGSPIHGLRQPGGFYAHLWSSMQIPPASKTSDILYFGGLEPLELADLYRAADAFVSVGTHHNEDYGMSVAESLLCGCPAILANWGGFADFSLNVPDGVRLLPVFWDLHGMPRMSQIGITQAVSEAMKQRISDDARENIASAALNSLSIEAAARSLAELPEEFPRFAGFTPLIAEIALWPHERKLHHSLYRQLYFPYAGSGA